MQGNSLPQVSGAYHDRLFISTCIHAYWICDSRVDISCFATPSLPCIGDEEGLFLQRDCRRDIKLFKNLRSEQVLWRYLRWSWFISLAWMWVEYMYDLPAISRCKTVVNWDKSEVVVAAGLSSQTPLPLSASEGSWRGTLLTHLSRDWQD